MFDHAIFDVAIGLALVYLVFSLLCSTLVEFIAGLLSLRGRQLERGIQYLLEDRALMEQVVQHPLLSKLSDKHRKASYIPAENFRIALLDSIGFLDELGKPEQAIENLPKAGLRISLDAMWKDCQGDYALFKEKVETWFSANMVRVSGWYKRQIQKLLLLVAFILAAMFNLDSFRIAQEIPQNPAIRAAIAEQLPVIAPDLNKDAVQNYQALQIQANQLEALELPFGWWGFAQYSANFDLIDWLLMVLGWLLTAFAASMGADFWFSSIGKVINLRAAGQPADRKKS